MKSMLEELLRNAENNAHIIQFTIDESQYLTIEAPFNLRIIEDQCICFVEAPTRLDAIQKVMNSGLPIKQFTELQ